MNKSTGNLGELFEKSSQIATKNLKSTLQSAQLQTLKLVSTSDASVKSFLRMNDSKVFLRVVRDSEDNF